MDKLTYLKNAKAFLRKVIDYRRFLEKKGYSRLSGEFSKQEIANIDAALPKIVSSSQARNYIQRKEAAIRFLIPTNKKQWYAELTQLGEAELN